MWKMGFVEFGSEQQDIIYGDGRMNKSIDWGFTEDGPIFARIIQHIDETHIIRHINCISKI